MVTATRFDALRVVSSARWLAEDFAAASVLPVHHDLGLDLRAEPGARTAWWAPMSFAARLIATTGVNAFLAPGPHWTARLPRRWTGRGVVTARFEDIEAGRCLGPGGPVHVKPSEVKVASVPAAVYPSLDAFLATRPVLHPQTIVQVSEAVDYVREVRCFTAGRNVVASSVYLDGGVTWDAWDLATAPSPDAGADFAARVLADPDVQVPPAMALDVGQHPDGTWSVIEANPAWSSNPYHADLAGVVGSICLAQPRGGEFSNWLWQPDPQLAVALRRPLPVLGQQ